MDIDIVNELVTIRESLHGLQDSLHQMRNKFCDQRDTYTDKSEIYAALAKAQGSYKPLIPNDELRGEKFGNLAAILAATRHALSENGLCFIQEIELLDQGSGAAVLKTKIGHSSGQEIVSVARVVHNKLDRLTGNAYENQKRLHASTLLGIPPSAGDPVFFDDGGVEQADSATIEELKKPRAEQTFNREEVITNEQYQNLMFELDGYPEIVKNIFTVYGIETLADLPREKYYNARLKIRTIKHTLDEYKREKQGAMPT